MNELIEIYLTVTTVWLVVGAIATFITVKDDYGSLKDKKHVRFALLFLSVAPFWPLIAPACALRVLYAILLVVIKFFRHAYRIAFVEYRDETSGRSRPTYYI